MASVNAVRRHARVAVAAPRAGGAGERVFQINLAEMRHETLRLRQVYELPAPGFDPAANGEADGEDGGRARHRVRVVNKRVARQVHVRIPAQRGVSGYGVYDHAHAAESFVRSGVAVSGREQRDYVGLDLAELAVSQAELVHYAVGVVGEDDVADADELLEGVRAALGGQV